jgi:hypothetical protein
MWNNQSVESTTNVIQQTIQYIAKGWKARKRKNIVLEQSSTSDKVCQSISRQSEILGHATN